MSSNCSEYFSIVKAEQTIFYLFLQGSYEVSHLDLNLPKVDLPQWLVDGKYGVEANAYDNANKHLGCIKIQLHLK